MSYFDTGLIDDRGIVSPYAIEKRITDLKRDMDIEGEEHEDYAEWREELDALTEFREDVEGASGRTWDSIDIVASDDFENFAREYAQDHTDNLDLVDTYVDWKAFADSLKIDYSPVECDGKTFYVR